MRKTLEAIGQLVNLEDETTKKYIDSGFYIDDAGQIWDTLFWPGDTVKIINPTIVGFGLTYTIEYIDKSPNSYYNTRDDIARYQRKKYNGYFEATNVKRAGIKLIGKSNMINPKNFELVNGANNMTLALEQNKPTFVREFREVLQNGEPTREYIGTQVEYKTLSAAKTYVATQISDSIRQTNTYRKFAVFQEVYTAQAKQPEVEFV